MHKNRKGRTLGEADLAAAMLLQLPKHLIQIAGLDVAHPGTAAAARAPPPPPDSSPYLPVSNSQDRARVPHILKYTRVPTFLECNRSEKIPGLQRFQAHSQLQKT